MGTILILGSQAASPYANSEAESGALSGATQVTDGAASAGKAVQFGVSPTPPPTTDGFSVVGGTIRNASNQVVQIHGVSLSSTEWSCNGGGNFPASAFATMKNQWNANAVRIPITQYMWLSNSRNYCSGYKASIDGWIQAAEANGMVVILDLHWSDRGDLNYSPGNVNQQCMPDVNSNTFWQQVANTYKGDQRIWFELYNEPKVGDWNLWKNGGTCDGFQAVGMQQLVNTVRGTGATNIVIAGGINYASHLDGVPLLSGSNVVYAIHPYANDINGGDPNAWSNNDWDNRFGYLVNNGTAPVLATEFGDVSCGNSYDQGVLDYFRNHGVGFTGWAWYVGGCGYPSLISNFNGTCAANMGCTIQNDMKRYPAGL